MDKPEKRIDLDSELGMTRRDLIRRGAIVGGTLLWVAPAIQSMAPKAFAAAENGSILCSACYCWNGDDKQNPTGGQAGDKGNEGSPGEGDGLDSTDDCAAWCNKTGKYAGSVGTVFQHSEFCTGRTNCHANQFPATDVPDGAVCT